MPATFVTSSGSGTAGSGGTILSVSGPASVVAGNLLVAYLACRGAGGGTISSSGGLSGGWTLAAETGIGTADYGAVFWRIATAGDVGGSYTASCSRSAFITCAILQYSGTPGLDGTPL